MTMQLKPIVAAMSVAWLLAACGGGGDDGGDTPTPPDPGPPVQTDKFTSKGNRLVFESPAATEGEHCFDLDKPGQERMACEGTAWDLKVSMPTAANPRGTPAFWTNSGDSGPGQGGALGGPFDNTWSDLQRIENATIDPDSGQPVPAQAFLVDGVSGAFTGTNAIGSAAFEYNLTGDNKLHPNFRAFQVTLDRTAPTAANTYVMQVLSYYGGPGDASGYLTVRLAGLDNPTQYASASIDARTGWQYLNLTTGKTVAESGDWHVAFNRYNIKLNPAKSGVGAMAGDTPPGMYDASGKPVTSVFTSTGPNSTAVLALVTGATVGAARDYQPDAKGSPLQPEGRIEGTYPNMTVDYGWYLYDAKTHLLTAKADRGSLLRSGEGNSYMRFHLLSIEYTPAGDYNGKQTWTLEYDLQPAAGS